MDRDTQRAFGDLASPKRPRFTPHIMPRLTTTTAAPWHCIPPLVCAGLPTISQNSTLVGSSQVKQFRPLPCPNGTPTRRTKALKYSGLRTRVGGAEALRSPLCALAAPRGRGRRWIGRPKGPQRRAAAFVGGRAHCGPVGAVSSAQGGPPLPRVAGEGNVVGIVRGGVIIVAIVAAGGV